MVYIIARHCHLFHVKAQIKLSITEAETLLCWYLHNDFNSKYHLMLKCLRHYKTVIVYAVSFSFTCDTMIFLGNSAQSKIKVASLH